MPGNTVREFRDPIHGFIDVHPHEAAIIDTYPLQRLRRISQLGLTSLIYHGAEHSRFGHSLGVMHLAGEATAKLLKKHGEIIRESEGWSEAQFDERSVGLLYVARLAGLLHDVGHAPFSHTGERQLFHGNLRHEEYSVAIIENSEIGDLVDQALAEYGMTRADVVGVLRGVVGGTALGFITQLLSSPYDVDKMDYLLRDSHHCGVEYGTFDIRRLIATLTLDDEDPSGALRLAVEEGGYHTLEALIIARYFMFTQVYFHPVRRAYDLVLTDFIQETLQEESGSPSYPPPEQIQEYLRWDDSRVLSSAVQRSDSGSENLAWMICNRRHPKTVYETLPHPDPLEARRAYRTLLPEAQAKFPEVRFWPDAATDRPDRYRQEPIPIKFGSEPPVWRSIVTTSTVLRGLEEIGQMRLYAFVGNQDGLRQEISQFCRQQMA